jgi:hypothetical protein
MASLIVILAFSLLTQFQGRNLSIITASAQPRVTVGPVTVAVETWNITTLEAFQRKTFFAHNKYWVFWGEAETYYKTSTDGLTWSTANDVCPGSGEFFSLWFDGTYVSYVRSTGIPTELLLYRRGRPNADGTITWSTPNEQVVVSTNTSELHEPFISVDSEGYPWIGYRWGSNTKWPNCTKSSLNNGTWQTAQGFPYQLFTAVTLVPNWAVSIVPLTQQKMYAVYLCSGAVRGRLWNGTAFENEELIANAVIGTRTRFAHSVVAKDDNVYLVFLNATTTNGDILFFSRTYGASWSEKEVVQPSASTSSFPVLSLNMSDGSLYCFWANNDAIYYEDYTEGAWNSNATTLAAENNLYEQTLSCSYESRGSRIEVIWINGTIDNCHIRFCSLITGTTYKLTVTSSTGGTTSPQPGSHYYIGGSPVDVTANAASGYSFGYWLLDGDNRTENPINIIMDANHTLEAVFVDNISPDISTPTQEPSESIIEYQNVTITVDVIDLGRGVHNVTLWYQTNGTTTWLPIDMIEISLNTYRTEIPGCGNSTLVKYRIIAYDNAGNEAVKDNAGQYYSYLVISEYSSILILPLFITATLLALVFCRKKKPV